MPFRNFLRGAANRRTTFINKSPTTIPSDTTTIKTVAPSSTRFSRPAATSRRKYVTRTTTARILESQDTTMSTTTRPRLNLFASVSRRPFLRRTAKPTIVTTTVNSSIYSDQNKMPSESDSFGKLSEIVMAIQNLQHSPTPKFTTKAQNENNFVDINEPEDLITTEIVSTTTQSKRKISSTKLPSRIITSKSTTTLRPKIYSTLKAASIPPRHSTEQTMAYTSPFLTEALPTDFNNRILQSSVYNPYRSDYNFFDSKTIDAPASLTDQLPEHSKVLLHGNGVIECLDQGNFPHPISCKKFISCAKMENGKMIGWEYTCPKNLSFDPIGGICNWSADVLCDDS